VAHIHCEEVFGVIGENFSFPVKINQRIEEMTWKKNKDKVAEWERQKNTTYYLSLRGRSLLKDNGCLTILNLEKSDIGTYELHHRDAKQDHYLTFILDVLDPPSEPEISCSISGDNFVLKCTADFQRPLNYAWKFSNKKESLQTQEIYILKENVDSTQRVTCFVKFSQTEKSSEISLAQCFP
ncbi:Lymphocyte function-associated antigen 3, partial [Acanthisitta chloris]